ncbi:hypothetical protein [Amycolatopsis magusensis]|uniref:hypothetical protein n=1 Tax=Amycolatopsis magusensis TaxID=882444 RepID=UPI0037A67D5F
MRQAARGLTCRGKHPAWSDLARRAGGAADKLGQAELVTVEVPPVAPDYFSKEVIRVRPRRVISWHLERERDLHSRTV